MKIRPWLVMLVAILGVDFSETASADRADPLLDPWRWVRFTTDSGLPSNRILDVVEVADGTPWAATLRGLAWYDGWQWISVAGVPVDQKYSIYHWYDDQILVHSGTRLFRVSDRKTEWIGLQWEGVELEVVAVAVLERERVMIEVRNSPPRRFWVMDTDHSLAPLELQFGREKTPDTVLQSGGLPFFVDRFGLEQYRDGKWKRVIESPGLGLDVRQIAEAGDGRGLAHVARPSSMRGLWEWNSSGANRVSFPSPTIRVRTLDVSQTGDAVVVYQSGAARVRRGGEWSVIAPTPAPLRLGRFVRFRRNDSDLWVGTRQGLFLCRSRSNRWERWPRGPEGEHDVVYELLPREDGSTWVGTLGGISIRDAEGSREVLEEIEGVRIRGVTALAADRQGHIWIGSGAEFEGVFRWDGREWQHFGENEGLPVRHVHKIRIDRLGRPWLLGLTGYGESDFAHGPGAFVWDGSAFEAWGEDQGLLSGRVYDFCEAADGTYYFGTWLGLSRWKGGKWRHWRGDANRGGRVFAIELSPDGELWASTQYLGATKIEGDERLYVDGFSAPITESDLPRVTARPGAECMDFCFDSEQRLWAATREGLLLRQSDRWTLVDQSYGLPDTRLWPVVSRGGELIVGTDGLGVAVLRVDALVKERPRVIVNLPRMDNDGVQLEWWASSYWERFPSSQLETRYRLDDNAWSTWSLERKLVLGRLAGGGHEFHVEARNPFATEFVARASATIEVPLPLYRDPWFYMPLGLSILVGLAVGLQYSRYRKRQALALAASEERHRRLFDSSRDGIVLLDEMGRISEVNPAAAELFGSSPQQLQGVCFEDLLAQCSEFGISEERPLVTDAPSPPRSVELVTKTEKRKYAEIMAGQLQLAGSPMTQIILRDITERRRLERAAQQSQRMEALGTLTGGVAHDFNNLLAVIIGSADLILAKSGDGTKEAESIIAAAERGDQLTSRLLAFSRRQPLEEQSVDLAELVDQVLGMLSRVLGDNIDVESQVPANVWRIKVDRGQLENALVNLAINSRDAMPNGGTLTVVCGNERRASEIDGTKKDYVMLAVRDTGLGMSGQVRLRAVEPFFTTKRLGAGNGLGLSTVYGFITQSGGQVVIDSNLGEGTLVRLYLPREDSPGPEIELADRSAVSCGKGENVLIIEDSAQLRIVTEGLLESLGYQSTAVADAADAHSTIEGGFTPDVILSDVVLPGDRSGPEFVRDIRRDHPGLRVIFMSGYPADAATQSGQLIANEIFLEKPFRKEDLGAALARVFGRGGS